MKMKLKLKLSVLALLLTFFGFGQLVIANENQGLSLEEMDQIKATCKEDSRDAENPEYYMEECISQTIQAVKEEKGLVETAKEEG